MYSWYEVSWKGGRTAVRAKSAEDAKRLWCNFNGYLHELPNMQVHRICDGDKEPDGYYNVIR